MPSSDPPNDWAQRQLRTDLDAATTAFAACFSAPPASDQETRARLSTIGLLPAVYLPTVRLGAVLFDWADPDEMRVAFRWDHTAPLPPPTCFVPDFGEERVTLITHVAHAVRRPFDSQKLTYSRALDRWVGAATWTRSSTDFVLDAAWLRDAGIGATTVLYFLDRDAMKSDYVPLLYFQSDVEYDAAAAERALRVAVGAVDIANEQSAEPSMSDAEQTLVARAARSVCHAAHARAGAWLNAKTRLLNQRGFEAVRRDVAERIEKSGRVYAEVFFDIDNFKALNDELGYALADKVAAEVARRALGYLHGTLARTYALFARPQATTGDAGAAPKDEPDPFGGFLCHVSGDEFKLFVRTSVTREHFRASADDNNAQRQAREILEFREFLDGLVRAVSGKGDLVPWLRQELGGPLDTRFEKLVRRAVRTVDPPAYVAEAEQLAPEDTLRLRAIAPRRSTQGVAFPPGGSTLGDMYGITISIGAAVLGYGDAPPAAGGRAVILDALTDLDTLAERALDGAKKRGRNRVMFFDELLDSGGVVLERLPRQVRLSVGETDGVKRGTLFDVMEHRAAPDEASPEDADLERRAVHASGWVARVEVHDIWPREALAHVVSGTIDDVTPRNWLRIVSGPESRAPRRALIPRPKRA